MPATVRCALGALARVCVILSPLGMDPLHPPAVGRQPPEVRRLGSSTDWAPPRLREVLKGGAVALARGVVHVPAARADERAAP
eukprot:1412265-Prymnesium_polylepis.1